MPFCLFWTLLQPKTTHFSGMFSALRPRWRSEQLKSGFYITNHTRPIPFRRILRLGNGFSNLDFSAIWKFIENSSFDQKQKFFRHFAQHDTMIHLGQKIFRGYGHFQDSFFLTSNYSISHDWIASLAQFVPINDIFSLKAENRGGEESSLRFRKQFGRKKSVKEISEQGDIDLVCLHTKHLGV